MFWPGAGLLAAMLSFTAFPAVHAGPSETVPFEEIKRGEFSGYRYVFPGFTGAELHITNRRAWAEFWSLHTRGR